MYEKPKLERLGSLRELTRGTKWLNFNDGWVLGDSDDPIGERS